MFDSTWMLVSIAALIILLGVVFFYYRKKSKVKASYKTLFITGVIWVPLGIVLGSIAMVGLGFVLASVGLAHKNKWKNNEAVSEGQREIIIALVLIGVILFAIATFIFSGITAEV